MFIIILTLVALQLYEWSVGSVLLLLHRARRSPEDLRSLLLVSTLFWTGPMAATIEMAVYRPSLGLAISIGVSLIAIAEVIAINRILRLSFGASLLSISIACAAFLTVATALMTSAPANAGVTEIYLYALWWGLAALMLPLPRILRREDSPGGHDANHIPLTNAFIRRGFTVITFLVLGVHLFGMPIGQMLSIISEHTRRQGLIKIVKKGTRLWRGRVHAKCDSLVNDHEFASPPQQFATQPNRMSPAGISMFYGAEDFGTAKIETAPNSPSPGSCFSAVQFESCDDFYILDLVDIPFGPSFFQAGSGNARHSLTFLRTFSSNLSKPIEQDHKIHIEYVPTQAFTEYVRFNLKTDDEMHLSGIRYRSSRNGRPCVVLFMD